MVTEDLHSSSPQSAWSVACILLAVATLVKLPLLSLTYPFYDDGETLYHALAMLHGYIPYRDDISHHHVGYALPFMLAGSVVGIHEWLLRAVGILTQTIIGVTIVHLCLALAPSLPRWLALVAGIAYCTAREPFTLHLSPLVITTALLLFATLLSVRSRSLMLAACVAGLACCTDQRAALGVFIPLLCVTPRSASQLSAVLTAWAAPILVCLFVLWRFDALTPYIEQTIMYPLSARGAAHAAWLPLTHLASTELLLICGLIGYLRLVRSRPCGILAVVTYSVIACGIALTGGRDFDYYTIPLLPVLSIGFALTLHWLWQMRYVGKAAVAALILMVPGIPLLQTIFTHSLTFTVDDGSEEIVRIISTQLPPQASLYIWGYRPDLYVRTGRLSPFPEVNRQLIHPDGAFTGRDERRAHIVPTYEARFQNAITESPPDFLLICDRGEPLWSPSDETVRELARTRYLPMATLEGTTIANEPMRYALYRRRG